MLWGHDNTRLHKLELYKSYYKIENEQVPNYFTTVINPLTHYYNTRRQAIQQLKTIHAFAQHNCIFSMIYLINKSPIIKLRAITCHNIHWRSLRSESNISLVPVHGRSIQINTRLLNCRVSTTWNSLPKYLRIIKSFILFKKHLKTYLFSL